MKNYELLNMIAEVDEDYVLAAGANVSRPRFGWKTLAVCAACAALIVAAYPASQAFNRQPAVCAPEQNEETADTLIEPLGLHSYILVEDDLQIMDTEGTKRAPAGGADAAPAPMPESSGGAYVGDDKGSNIDGESYYAPGQDAPVQEEAAAQYLGLLQGLGGQGGYEPETYPDWFAGAWIDNSYYPEAKLAVAIVAGFRTPELEAQIEEWCGGTGEVILVDAKYSKNHLDGLMDPVTKALDGTGLSGGIGVDVTANCLGVDIYSDGNPIPDAVLAELARLDPGGDAILVRLFTGKLNTLTDKIAKGPAPDVPAAPEERATVTEDASPSPTPIDGDSQPDAYAPAPGGITQPAVAVQEGGAQESSQPAGDLPGSDSIYRAGE